VGHYEIILNYQKNIRMALALSLLYAVLKLVTALYYMHLRQFDYSLFNISLVVSPFLLHYLFYMTKGVTWITIFYIIFISTKLAYFFTMGYPLLGFLIKIFFSFFFIKAIIAAFKLKKLGRHLHHNKGVFKWVEEMHHKKHLDVS